MRWVALVQLCAFLIMTVLSTPYHTVCTPTLDTQAFNEIFLVLPTQIEINNSPSTYTIYDRVTQISPSDVVFLELIVKNQGDILKSVVVHVMTHNASWIRTYRRTEDIFTCYHDFSQSTSLVIFLEGLRGYQGSLKIVLTVDYQIPLIQDELDSVFLINSGKLIHAQIQDKTECTILPTLFHLELLGNEHFQLFPFKSVVQTFFHNPRPDDSQVKVTVRIESTEEINRIALNGWAKYDYNELNNEITVYTTSGVSFLEIALEMEYQPENVGRKHTVEVRLLTVESETRVPESNFSIGPHPLPSGIVYLSICAFVIAPPVHFFIARKRVGQHIDESSLFK